MKNAINRYIDATQTYKKSVVNAVVFPEIPRLFIEPLGITAIFLVGVLPQVLSGQQEKIIESFRFCLFYLLVLLNCKTSRSFRVFDT